MKTDASKSRRDPCEMAEAFKSFTEPHKIYTDPEQEMQGFMTVFVNKLSDRLKNQQPSALKSPGP